MEWGAISCLHWTSQVYLWQPGDNEAIYYACSILARCSSYRRNQTEITLRVLINNLFFVYMLYLEPTSFSETQQSRWFHVSSYNLYSEKTQIINVCIRKGWNSNLSLLLDKTQVHPHMSVRLFELVLDERLSFLTNVNRMFYSTQQRYFCVR